jgi:hypothetical protein
VSARLNTDLLNSPNDPHAEPCRRRPSRDLSVAIYVAYRYSPTPNSAGGAGASRDAGFPHLDLAGLRCGGASRLHPTPAEELPEGVLETLEVGVIHGGDVKRQEL